MIVIFGVLLGAIIGTFTARKRKGNKFDMLQYGFGYAVLFGVLGMFLTIVAERLLG
jgi:prolipoprotein diacylglyceryltransferase